ncbi:MAG: hypothetical protein AAGL89_18565 [Pseudomonadota bacterium]
MNLHRARYAIGLLVLLGHFSAIGTYLYLVSAKFPQPEITMFLDGVAALTPFTLLYATVFYRYVVANPTASQAAVQAPMGWGPFLIQFFLVAMFIVALHVVMLFGFNNIASFGGLNNIPMALAGVDSVFAVFVSMTFSTLFPLEWEASRTKRPDQAAKPDPVT